MYFFFCQFGLPALHARGVYFYNKLLGLFFFFSPSSSSFPFLLVIDNNTGNDGTKERVYTVLCLFVCIYKKMQLCDV